MSESLTGLYLARERGDQIGIRLKVIGMPIIERPFPILSVERLPMVRHFAVKEIGVIVGVQLHGGDASQTACQDDGRLRMAATYPRHEKGEAPN